MNPSDVVLPINSFIGKTVNSLSSRNKLGEVREVYFEPTDGFVTTLTLTGSDVDDAETSYLEYSHIHSFGHDAIMADDDGSVLRAAAASLSDKPELRQMLGASLITENGNSLGQI